MRLRNLLIIIGLVIVLGIIVFFFFFRGAPPSAPATTGQTGSLPSAPATTGNTLPAVGASSSAPLGVGGPVAIIDTGPVAGYFTNASGTMTVVRADGTIVSIANGQTISLSSSSISNLISAAFSFDGRKIAVTSGSASNPQTSIFDAQSRTWSQFSMGMLSPVWSPLDYRLAFLRNGGAGAESLNVIDLNKAKAVLATLGTWFVQDMALQWDLPGTIMLSSHPSAFADSSVLAFNVVKGTIAPVVVSRAGFWAIWNGTPQMGLSFGTTAGQRGGNLQLIDASGAVFQNMSFLTMPSKCAFGQAIGSTPSRLSQIGTSSPTAATSTLSFYLALYCAVPNDQAALSYYPLPDAYLQHAILTNDTLYRVNTTTGHIDAVLAGVAPGLDAIMLRAVGNKLYFVNWYDKKLYSVTTP